MEQRTGLYSGNELLSVQSQKQKLTGAVIQGVELLTLPTATMSSYLAEAILSNPMLDLTDPENERTDTPMIDDLGDRDLSEGPEDFSAPFRSEKRKTASGHDGDELLNLKGSQFELDTLGGSLELQLSMCGLSPVENAIGKEIIGNIDERGYFVGSLPTICCYYGVGQDTGERVLSTIQSFVPRGIAARDVYECLCLQVGDEAPCPEITRRMIREDLESLGENRTADCVRKYRLSEQGVREIFAYIRTLEPRPGNCDIPHENICYTQPDLIILKKSGEYIVRNSGEGDFPLKLNEEYLRMLECADLTAQEKDYLRIKLEEARALMRSLTIRQQILHKFALSLLKLQNRFFRFGAEELCPLTMQRMAKEMGVNVSTVSRIVQGKYMETPWGMYPFKYFFSGACSKGGEEAVSVQVIKNKIRELAGAKEKAASLNDTQICARLQEAGYRISRRTVTKYRLALGLARQGRRRDYSNMA